MMIRRYLALAAVAIALAACSSGNAADATADGVGGELQATDWVLDSYAANGALAVVPPDQYADADFRANRVKGFAGCNDYDAVYVSNGRGINIGFPLTTLMSCGETADAFQSSFITLLLQGRYYNVRNDTLTIRAADLSIVLVFTPAPSNPLLGSWIVDGLATAPSSVSVPLEGTNLTAVFRIKTVSGSSGCNSYQGPYTTNGKLAAIGPLAGTQIACPQDIMTQEQAFLKDMQGVGKVERRGDHATLSDLSGSLLVSLVRPSIEEASPSPSASASASPSASATPTTKPSATPSTAPTATPTATATSTSTPTATPTAPPTAPPTATPVASGTPAP